MKRAMLMAMGLVGLTACLEQSGGEEEGLWQGTCALDLTWDLEVRVIEDREGEPLVGWGALVSGDTRYPGELKGQSLSSTYFRFEVDGVFYKLNLDPWGGPGEGVLEGTCALTDTSTDERLEGELYLER
jgi:hypothetical protein